MDGRAGQVRKVRVAEELDAFVYELSGGRRGWIEATPDDVIDWFCFLDSQGKGTKWVHERSCPHVGSSATGQCPPGFTCAKRYAAESFRTSFNSKLRSAY